ncbi:MAG: CvpA family protein [Terrimicrobiaceae bacterium]|jgi:hypothetical protein
MNVSHGSPLWQGVLFFAASLFLLWELWYGWRRGIVRSGINFCAFVFSGFLGVLAGQATAFVVEKILPGYGFLAGALAGSMVTLVVLCLVLFLGAVLFKRTGQQPSGLLRLFYGIGGGFFGLLTGLLLLWGGITIIRAFGIVAGTTMGDRSLSEAPLPAKALVTLKDSLELGPAGKLVESVDVVPPDIYELIQRIGKLMSDQDAMMRFLDYPGVQEIMQHPRMAALLRDPEIVRDAQERNFLGLMRSRGLLDAVNDPSLQKQISRLDLQKALDYAFPGPQSSPSPGKKP